MNLKEILKAMKKEGADQAEVSCLRSSFRTVTFENNLLKSLHSTTETTWRLRAVVENRLGSFSTNRPEQLLSAARQVVAMARASLPDPYAVLPCPQPVQPVPGLFHKQEVDLKEVLQAGCQLVETFRKYDRRVSVDSASVEVTSSEVAIVSTRGVKAEERRSCTQYFLMGLAAEGTTVSSFDYRFNAGVSWKETVAKIQEDAIQLASELTRSLGARTAPVFTGDVLLSPETVADFISALDFLINARNVQERRSRFAGKINQPVASSCLTIVDKPLQPGLPWSTSFDSEGVATRTLTVVEKGVLRAYLYDTYAAVREQRSSTGHADGQMHQPTLEATASLKEMQSAVRRGVLVRRFSGNISPINGVVSGLVKGGWYIENGQLLYPITDTMLSGDFFQMLKKVVAISRETEPTPCGYLPYMLVEGVTILGDEDKGT